MAISPLNRFLEALRVIGASTLEATDGGLWSFDNDVLDTLGPDTNNDATATGLTYITSIVPDITVKSGSFDGSTTHVVLPSAIKTHMLGTGDKTVIFLFKHHASASADPYALLGGRLVNSPYAGVSFGIRGTGFANNTMPDLWFVKDGSNYQQWTVATNPILQDTVYMIAYVVTGTGASRAVTFYRGAIGSDTDLSTQALTASTTGDGADGVISSTADAMIGAVNTTASPQWMTPWTCGVAAYLPHAVSAKELQRLFDLARADEAALTEEVNAASFFSWIRANHIVALSFGDSRTNGDEQSWWNSFVARGVVSGVVPQNLGQFFEPREHTAAGHITAVKYSSNWRATKGGDFSYEPLANVDAPFDWGVDIGSDVGKGYPFVVFTHSAANQAPGTIDVTMNLSTYGNNQLSSLYPDNYFSTVYRGAATGLSYKSTKFTRGALTKVSYASENLAQDVAVLVDLQEPMAEVDNTLTISLQIVDATDVSVNETSKAFAVIGTYRGKSSDGQSPTQSTETGMIQLWSISEDGWKLGGSHDGNAYYVLDSEIIDVCNALSQDSAVEPETSGWHLKSWLFVMQADVNDAAAGTSAATFKTALENWSTRVHAFCSVNGITDYRLLYIHSYLTANATATLAIWQGYRTKGIEWAQSDSRYVFVSTSARYLDMVPRRLLRADGGSPTHLQLDTSTIQPRNHLVDTFWDIVIDAQEEASVPTTDPHWPLLLG